MLSEYRRGGVWIRIPVRIEPDCDQPQPRPEPGRYSRAQRRLSALMASFRLRGCTPQEMKIITGLMLDGKTEQEVGDDLGMSRQAVSWHVAKMAHLVPEFHRWFINQDPARRGRRPRRRS